MKLSTIFKMSALCLFTACTTIPPKSSSASPTTPAKAVSETVKLNIVWNKLKSAKIDLNVELRNDTKTGIDLAKAIWTLDYAGQRGTIYNNSFDRIVIGPNSAREGIILWKFANSFEQNEKFSLTLENVTDLNGKAIPPVKVTGTFSLWKFTLDN